MSMHPAGDGSTINGGEVGICSRCCRGNKHTYPRILNLKGKKSMHACAHICRSFYQCGPRVRGALSLEVQGSKTT